MVIRILGSKICRPSKFHKPKCYTYRTNSTSSDQRDDEVAKRQHYQKIIDFVFGPPTFQELDSIKAPNLTAKEDGVTIMERSKEKAMLSKTDDKLGRVHEPVQDKEELPQQEATVGAIDTQLEQNSQKQGQQVEESVVRATAEKDEAKKYDSLQKSFPNLNSTNIDGPNYYREMETQMYNNLAKKYLKRETNQIDTLLAKEMENLEHRKSVQQSDDADPVNVPKRAAYTPSDKAEPQTYYTGNTSQCQQCSNDLEPHQNIHDTATASSNNEKLYEVYKLESSTNAPYDELVPLHLTQCLDQVDSVPESNNIHTPLEKLQLDENQPTHFLLPATLNKDNGADWDDVSRTIIQPIGTCTIFQFRAHPGPSGCTNLEGKVGALTHESHRMQETKVNAEVPYEIVNILMKPKCFQEQSNILTKTNLIEANVSEHTDTSKRSWVQAQIVNENIIGQPESSTQAKQKQVVKDDFVQQADIDTSRIMEDTDRIRRTDTMVQSCVHAQALPKTGQKTESARSIDDVIIDAKLSLSEVLKRVRAYNRLQYCKEIGMQALNLSSMIASKRCPPSDRPQSPPPPDCEKKCPPPSKPKCPASPECPPEKKCPPPQPKCPPDPPKCPDTSPPPGKCPGKCGYQSTDPYAPITVAYGRLSLNTLFSCNMTEYLEKITQWLLKLRKSSLDSAIFMAGPNLEAEILQLNRVKDFEPWTPIPSWPYPLEDKERKLQCPYHGCPAHKPGPVRPPCPPSPCSGLPKRLSFSPF